MAALLRNRPIATWKAGDAVQGYALVRRRELRQDKSGRDYLDLELADASGSIAAKAWSDSKALAHAFAAHDFVKFAGQVQSYREQLQLKLDNCRVASADDREDGFDELLTVARMDAMASNGDLTYVEFCERRRAELGAEAVRPPRLLGGDDLMALGYEPGPRFGEILRALEEAQLEGEVKTRPEAERFVAERFPR